MDLLFLDDDVVKRTRDNITGNCLTCQTLRFIYVDIHIAAPGESRHKFKDVTVPYGAFKHFGDYECVYAYQF